MAVIDGTANADSLPGTEGADTIDALGGDDFLTGLGGNDSLIAGDGRDEAFGDGGDDAISGGNGDDLLDGGEGNDTISGGDGFDRLVGGAGADSLDGGNDSDEADYAADPAAISVDLAQGTAQDGFGFTDTLSGIETVFGSAFNDTLNGSSAGDAFFGNGGDNVIAGRDGNDTLFGGPESDAIAGGNGNDSINGDVGRDLAVFERGRGDYTVFVGILDESAGSGITRSQSQYLVIDDAGPEGVDTLVGVERFAFGAGTTADACYLSIANAFAAEGNDGSRSMDFTINLSRLVAQEVSVLVATSSVGATAQAGIDYTATTALVTIPAGAVRATFSVPILADTIVEPYESFAVTVSDPVGARFRGDDQRRAIGTIVNDDGGVSPADDVAGDTSSTATLAIGGSVQGNIEANGDHDFYRVTLEAGTTYRIFEEGSATGQGSLPDPFLRLRDAAGGQLAANDDGGAGFNSFLEFAPQSTGTFFIDAGGFADARTGTYRLSLVNAASLPELTVNDMAVVEDDAGGLVMRFRVTRSFVSNDVVTVTATTVSGTAIAGQDFVQTSTVVTLSGDNGEQGFIDVPILTDAVGEPDETFTVALSNPGNAVIGAKDSAVGTIINDDAAQVSIAGGAITEGTGGTTQFDFAVSLIGGVAGRDTVVTYNTVAGTAQAGSDFTAVSGGQVTIQAGDTMATILVPITTDNLAEAEETFSVTLTQTDNPEITINPQGATAAARILNDDFSVLSIVGASIDEGDAGTGNLVFTIGLNGSAADPVTVRATTLNGAAVAGSDYVATTAVVTIPGGQGSATFAVPISGDSTFEIDETFFVELTNPTGPVVLSPSSALAIGTIRNDDQAVLPTINGQTINGSGSDDFLVGSALNDSIAGQAGADTEFGNEQSDILIGGNGNDFIVADFPADFLSGSADFVDAGNGNDNVFGGGGNDTLIGGNGNDLLAGDTGDNLILGGDGDNALFGFDGADTILGGNNGDIVFGLSGPDVIVTQGGLDLVIAGGPADGAADADFIDMGAGGGTVFAGAGDDTVIAGDGEDFMLGESGADMMRSGGNNDVLIAGSGDDTLDGGAGSDILIAEGGNDSLVGGTGFDTFRYPAGIAVDADRILDFALAEDTVELAASVGFADGAAAVAAVTQNGADAVLTLPAGAGTITFVGLNAANLTAADFAII